MEATSCIREAIGKVVPGFEQIIDIDRTRHEFHIPGRTLHAATFATPSGRAKLHTHMLPPLAGGEEELRLMTVRSEGQFNTVVYEEYDLYRGQDRRDVILLHPADIERLGFKPDQRVTVKSAAGELTNIVLRAYPEIRAGNALMYYPEANVLVPRHADPMSKTPAFKGIVIRLEAGVGSASTKIEQEPHPVELRTTPHKPLNAC
jgi:anaerobic selenocysteine-containing dehydrogenase